MNLELLDPFGRQIPDRVDSTLLLPPTLHFPHHHQQQQQSTVVEEKATTTTTTTATTTTKEDQHLMALKATTLVSFNRRGSYLAVAYASGTIAIFDILSRTPSSIYRFVSQSHQDDNDDDKQQQVLPPAAPITALSWSRRSRTLLAGRMGSPQVMLTDLTHPAGPEECCCGGHSDNGGGDGVGGVVGTKTDNNNNKELAGDDANDRSQSPTTTNQKTAGDSGDGGENKDSASAADDNKVKDSSFAPRQKMDFHCKESRRVSTRIIHLAKSGGSGHTTTATAVMNASSSSFLARRQGLIPANSRQSTVVPRYPNVTFAFPEALAGGSSALQVHPKDPLAGLAVLQDGSIHLFQVPPRAFEKQSNDVKDDENDKMEIGNEEEEAEVVPSKVLICKVFQSDDYEITCASFGPHGQRLYAATSNGKLLGFDVTSLFETLWNRPLEDDDDDDKRKDGVRKDLSSLPALQPNFIISIPGGACVWHLVVSRNGRSLVLNSADAAIRLYNTSECWNTPEEVDKPIFVFQDVVERVKFASCDISGDGEYIAGGAQGNDNKYEVYIWNTSTGVLADKLTGAPVNLSSVAWHPTRSFLAVAASDGLVDRWGPRINWTAFAPDFQALPQNVEYVEKEDEFDIVEDGGGGTRGKKDGDADDHDENNTHVDILTLHKIPVFQSDSEDEDEVFRFDVVTRAVGSGSG